MKQGRASQGLKRAQGRASRPKRAQGRATQGPKKAQASRRGQNRGAGRGAHAHFPARSGSGSPWPTPARSPQKPHKLKPGAKQNKVKTDPLRQSGAKNSNRSQNKVNTGPSAAFRNQKNQVCRPHLGCLLHLLAWAGGGDVAVAAFMRARAAFRCLPARALCSCRLRARALRAAAFGRARFEARLRALFAAASMVI